LVGCSLPLLDACVVDVLAAADAVGDVFGGGVEIFLADATFFGVGVGLEGLAILLKLGFEEGRGAADEVFMNGEAAVDIGDTETYDFVANAIDW
jgi:hypothetical protein